MILFLTRQMSPTSDCLMHLFSERSVPAFRFNTDLFDHYAFVWENGRFRIRDPENRLVCSDELSAIICYKAQFSPDEGSDIDQKYSESRWVKSWLNNLFSCLAAYGCGSHLLRLWQPFEHRFPKTMQMEAAKKYFAVPPYCLHWGEALPSRNVIVKPLTSRPLKDGSFFYAKIADRSSLAPSWPWFTQDIADGSRDATVLYINGKIHCWQFATERGELTDWRVTQGTDRNQWKVWDAGTEFRQKTDAYMREIGLKFGRLDFIIGGKEPQFLEVNPCGQFGWLDDGKLTLHNEVADAILDPASEVQI